MPEQWISGNRSMDTVHRPLCGCFVLSCMVGGIFRKPLGFRRCLPPARPEKAQPFQTGQSPCTKHPRLSGFAFTHRKKFLRVPRGVFSKTLPWQGVGQGPTKGEGEPAQRARLFRRDKVLSRNAHRPSDFAFTNLKKFLRVPRGVFSKTHPWQGVGRSPTKREDEPAQRGAPFQAGKSPFTKRPQTVRLGLHAPKKVFEGSQGAFFQKRSLAGSGAESRIKKAEEAPLPVCFTDFFR